MWWPGCLCCHLKRGLGVSAIAAAHARDPAEFSVPRVSLLFFSFFNRILIREPAKALKKRKQTNKINEQRQGRKKAFSGRSPWQG